ncbi:heparinase II/III domain-containing protein [Fusibacter bizertensis]
MTYCDIEKMKALMAINPTQSQFVACIHTEVESFFNTFDDSPELISRWGHHYFCKEDGGLLIYDRNKPKEHVCSICGKVYHTELLSGVWTYMYRNEGVTNAWKSALLYRLTGDSKYLDYVLVFAAYYGNHYHQFKLHNKEGIDTENDAAIPWGSSRIMPQSLNEAIFLIRLINALELVKKDIAPEFIEALHQNLFRPAFELFKSQVDKIHNISCWLNSAIGVMGLFLKQQDMIDFTFKGEFNIDEQLLKGVTRDYFWYEGSIHYNYFTLEGVINLLLFSKLYNYDFNLGEKYVEQMLIQGYKYAFDNHQLPNPNDGWPNVNLKSYSYIYAIGAKVFGADSIVGNLFKNIVNGEHPRGEFPLSKPYYFKNDISLEEFLFCTGIRAATYEPVIEKSVNFETSYCGLLKNKTVNLFYKYGHNGPSHAHPDKMNIEIVIKGKSLSRDLSNSGYGNILCNEWHRVSASHNTVVVDGENHTSVEGGLCLNLSDTSVEMLSEKVYSNIDFKRKVEINEEGYSDQFIVLADDPHVCDYFFHVEGTLLSELHLIPEDLGFKNNGYQHIKNVNRVVSDSDEITLKWDVDGLMMSSFIELNGKTLFIAESPDNPVTNYRTTLIIRSKENNPIFDLNWRMENLDVN